MKAVLEQIIYLNLIFMINSFSAFATHDFSQVAGKGADSARVDENIEFLKESPKRLFKKDFLSQRENCQQQPFDSILSQYGLLKPLLIIAEDRPYRYKINGKLVQYQDGPNSGFSDATPPIGVFYSDLKIKIESEEDLKLLEEKFGAFQKSKEEFRRKLVDALKSRKALSMIDLLPSFVRVNNGKFLNPWMGEEANCRNAVLCFHNNSQIIEYSDVNPLSILVESKGRELKKGETLSPGDIVSVWDNRKRYETIDLERRNLGRDDRRGHKHSVIYLGGDYFFGKDSSSALDPFGIKSFDDVFGLYMNNPELHFTFHRIFPKSE